jgi:hypothetical protein
LRSVLIESGLRSGTNGELSSHMNGMSSRGSLAGMINDTTLGDATGRTDNDYFSMRRFG